MKIVHLANHAQIVGNGIVNMMVDLACMQARAGHEVTVASSGGGFEILLAHEGVRHVFLAQSPQLRRLPAMLAGFSRLIAQFDPDVVHAHMMTGALLARFGRLRRRYLLVTTVHNEFQKSATLMGLANSVVAVSQSVAASMVRRGVPTERLHTVRNGTIGSPRFARVPLPEISELHHPCIVTVAGMYARKGIGDVLRAFAVLSDVVPDASLYLIGDGPDRSSFEALARELGVAERTHFMGFVLDPRAYLAGADVFVLASHKEAGGLVLSEAREAGCAIVATRVDGNPEMLDGGEAGLLVPPSSPGALANAIKLLLTNPRARAALVARTSLNLEAFHVQRVCDAYLSIYRIGLDAVNPQQAATGAQPAASREIPTKNVRMESHGFARNHDVMVGDQAVEDPDVRGFAVCVTTMNRVESLAACIKNLVRCVPRAACIFVSDDSTEAETRAANQTIAAQHPGVVWLEGPRRGVSANRNNAVLHCLRHAPQCDYVSFVDDYVLVAEDFFTTARGYLATLPAEQRHTVILTGACSSGAEPTEPQPTRLSFRGYFTPADQPQCVDIHAAVFSLTLFRQETWDENILFGAEDAELCLRALTHGYSIHLVPSLRACDTMPGAGVLETPQHKTGRLSRYQLHCEAARLYVGVKRYRVIDPSLPKCIAFFSIYFIHLILYLVRRGSLSSLVTIVRLSNVGQSIPLPKKKHFYHVER